FGSRSPRYGVSFPCRFTPIALDAAIFEALLIAEYPALSLIEADGFQVTANTDDGEAVRLFHDAKPPKLSFAEAEINFRYARRSCHSQVRATKPSIASGPIRRAKSNLTTARHGCRSNLMKQPFGLTAAKSLSLPP
ncbi:hypothetical protein, partial [uncultured Paracoccus sp.]|uniref:hypothetical protein n=1 Tax=uncultured Paracoccus sp. TaxID=189685 RepID=UPI0025EABB97